MIEWLENWYNSQCDGNWEHEFGIKIETLDNPGWEITIDLTNTDIEIPDEDWKFFKEDDSNWYGYKIEDKIFNASGDTKKLNFLISLFKKKISDEN